MKKERIKTTKKKKDINAQGLPTLVSALDRYMAEIKRYPYISIEEEHELAMKYFKNADMDAAHKLVVSNLRLVVKIAYDYMRTGFRLLDLIQEGNIGLMMAVKEFNPYKGVRLAVYAAYWIKAYIQNFIIKNWSLVKIGTTQAQRKLFYKLNQEKKRLEQLGFTPEVKLLSENLDVKEEEVTEMSKRLFARDASLDAPIRDDDQKSLTLLDIQKDQKESIEDILSEKQLKDKFNDKLKDFKKDLFGKNLYIFENRLMSDEPMTLQEIGDKFGITRERVRQIEENLLKKLKDFIKKEIPDIEIFKK